MEARAARAYNQAQPAPSDWHDRPFDRMTDLERWTEECVQEERMRGNQPLTPGQEALIRRTCQRMWYKVSTAATNQMMKWQHDAGGGFV